MNWKTYGLLEEINNGKHSPKPYTLIFNNKNVDLIILTIQFKSLLEPLLDKPEVRKTVSILALMKIKVYFFTILALNLI